MKESKEIDAVAKAKKFIDDFIKVFEGLEQYDDEPGTPLNADFTAAIMAGFYEAGLKHLTEINQTLRDQIKQFEKIPGLKELKEENERLDSEYRGTQIELNEQKAHLSHSQNRIKELEEGIAHAINNSSKLRSDRKNCDLLGDLLTKDTKNN